MLVLFIVLPTIAAPGVGLVDSTFYTFDASARTVTVMIHDLSFVETIHNTTDDVLIYEIGNPDYGGSEASGILTLNFNTTNMSDGDSLYIVYQPHTEGSGFKVNKYGHTINADSGVLTDIHDGADAGNVIWDAPTAARTHQIVSSDADDDGAPVGAGARTIEVCGLKTWALAETCEIIIMNGVTNVPTVNTYVIIHRMTVKTWGAVGPNQGIIKATADTDTTITATILALAGQTQMAILGIPSIQEFHMTAFYAGFLKAGGPSVSADITLCVNTHPDLFLGDCIIKHTDALIKDGTSHFFHPFFPDKNFIGPVIIKMQVRGDAADLDVSGGFDGFITTI